MMLVHMYTEEQDTFNEAYLEGRYTNFLLHLCFSLLLVNKQLDTIHSSNSTDWILVPAK